MERDAVDYQLQHQRDTGVESAARATVACYQDDVVLAKQTLTDARDDDACV